MCNESIEVKNEFMWAMKDFVSDNAPPKNMEQQIVAALDKERDQRGGRLKPKVAF